MIARAMQRSHHGSLCIHTSEVLKFNRLVTAWPPNDSLMPTITYNDTTGAFIIQNASLSDYLITWSISIRTSTATDGYGESLQIIIKYSDGEVSEGCFSCCTTGTGLMKGYKIIHIERISKDDILQFQVVNNSFYNDIYLTTPRYPIPTGFNENNIYNVNICITSI